MIVHPKHTKGWRKALASPAGGKKLGRNRSARRKLTGCTTQVRRRSASSHK